MELVLFAKARVLLTLLDGLDSIIIHFLEVAEVPLFIHIINYKKSVILSLHALVIYIYCYSRGEITFSILEKKNGGIQKNKKMKNQV